MATVVQFQPKQRPYSTIDRAIEDALTSIAFDFARGVYDRNVVSDQEIATALRQPVSLASVLADLAAVFGIETPELVEAALS